MGWRCCAGLPREMGVLPSRRRTRYLCSLLLKGVAAPAKLSHTRQRCLHAPVCSLCSYGPPFGEEGVVFAALGLLSRLVPSVCCCIVEGGDREEATFVAVQSTCSCQEGASPFSISSVGAARRGSAGLVWQRAASSYQWHMSSQRQLTFSSSHRSQKRTTSSPASSTMAISSPSPSKATSLP